MSARVAWVVVVVVGGRGECEREHGEDILRQEYPSAHPQRLGLEQTINPFEGV